MALAITAVLSLDRLTAASPGSDRTISFYHIHTQERLTVTYKKNGQFVPEALKQINWLMRDWRKNEQTTIDPQAIDLAWEMHEELGSREPIHVICGYRSRRTNELLRRTVGGQASQSQHITGRALDITFPDVPLKRMRYSALVRERGGVGYYPTSGIPFVHIDTARVRSWPRLPRYELALVFPNGHSQHQTAEGGSISPEDVRVARAKYRELAVQIAEFHDIRHGLKKPVLVAAATPAPSPTPAKDVGEDQDGDAALPKQPGFAVASLAAPSTEATTKQRKFDLKWETLSKPPAQKPAQVASLAQSAVNPPKLIAEPKLIDRSSQFSPSKADRGKLAALVQQAANMPMPKLIAGPAPALRPKSTATAAADSNPKIQLASLEPDAAAKSITDMSPDALGNGWAQAPAFDEDHPEELAYRPFPLAPLLTDSVNGEFESLQHPDVTATLDALDDAGAAMPMRFRPGQQVAQVLWAQQFEGKAVHLDALQEIDRNRIPLGFENRAVRTSAR